MNDWQPIETAPKDGREVLAWSNRDGTFVVFWYAVKGGWFWTTHDLEGDEKLNATHWMPLPAPPEVTIKPGDRVTFAPSLGMPNGVMGENGRIVPDGDNP